MALKDGRVKFLQYTNTVKARHKLKRMTLCSPSLWWRLKPWQSCITWPRLQPLPGPEIALERGWRKAEATIFHIFVSLKNVTTYIPAFTPSQQLIYWAEDIAVFPRRFCLIGEKTNLRQEQCKTVESRLPKDTRNYPCLIYWAHLFSATGI